MNKTSIEIWIMVLMLSSYGCATVQPIDTRSGMPEVTICGINKTEIMEKFVASASMDGWAIRNSSNFQIIVSKPLNNTMAVLLYGSKYDPTPESRVILTFADVGGCTYIGGRLQIVTNPGSAFERINDVSRGKDALELQEQLEKVKSLVEENQADNPKIDGKKQWDPYKHYDLDSIDLSDETWKKNHPNKPPGSPSAKFKPLDKVVCIDESGFALVIDGKMQGNLLTLNKVYTVASVDEFGNIQVEEISNKSYWFSPNKFKLY